MYIYIYIYICIYIYIYIHSSKIYLYYINFLLNTFQVSISGLLFVFIQVRILLSVCTLNSSSRCEEAAKKDIRILCYES